MEFTITCSGLLCNDGNNKKPNNNNNKKNRLVVNDIAPAAGAINKPGMHGAEYEIEGKKVNVRNGNNYQPVAGVLE